MNLSLTGFSGSGKTTVSRLLAEKLGKKLISTDEEFVKITKLGKDRFVKKHGIGKFLQREADIIESISDLDECIFDTNSEIVLRNENIINLKKNGLVILLTADTKTILVRLNRERQKSGHKGSFTDNKKTFFDEHFEKYKKAADYTIDTSNLSPEEICELIIYYLQMELQ